MVCPFPARSAIALDLSQTQPESMTHRPRTIVAVLIREFFITVSSFGTKMLAPLLTDPPESVRPYDSAPCLRQSCWSLQSWFCRSPAESGDQLKFPCSPGNSQPRWHDAWKDAGCMRRS